MKFLFDLFPVILFFITLKVSKQSEQAGIILKQILDTIGFDVVVKPDLVPIMLATVVVIIASVAQIAWVKIRHGVVPKALVFSAILVVIMGGLTLYFQNDEFIKWKPTLLYWGTAIVFVCAELFWKKNFIRMMMEKEMTLPENVWKNLNLAWAVFFTFMGFINLYIAYNFSIDTWATYKLFGTMALILVFTIAQSLFISKYIINEETS